jgi:site-specific DNA recombinase
MTALIAKREALSRTPVVRAGWVTVVMDRTYGEVWPTATTEERRKLLTDAGVTITITRPNIADIYVDLDKLLGDGPTAEQLMGGRADEL